MSGKNLTSVCKLVFKVAQEDENDALFLEGNFLGMYANYSLIDIMWSNVKIKVIRTFSTITNVEKVLITLILCQLWYPIPTS